jgi:hypothetical protein
MFTVMSSTRNLSLYVIGAVAIVLIGLLLQPVLPVITGPRPALIPVTGNHNAGDLFRQEELSLYDRPAASSIGSPSFLDYRRGEWSTSGMSAAESFRHDELALYSQRSVSSIGSPSFMDYRRGEWSSSVDAMGAFRQEELSLYNRPASSIGSDSFFEYRRGEWSGQ